MPKHHVVSLPALDRTRLTALLAAGRAPARILTHARILRKADQGSGPAGWRTVLPRPHRRRGQSGSQRRVQASGASSRARTCAGSSPSRTSWMVTVSSTARMLARKATQTSRRATAEPP